MKNFIIYSGIIPFNIPRKEMREKTLIKNKIHLKEYPNSLKFNNIIKSYIRMKLKKEKMTNFILHSLIFILIFK